MAAPTFVSYADSGFNSTTTPKTLGVTTQAGDRLAVVAIVENGLSSSSTAPTGNGNTFGQGAAIGTTDQVCRAIAWTCTEVAGGTYNISVPRPSSAVNLFWGAAVAVWRDSDGFGNIGAPTAGSTSNLVTFTTAQANSGLFILSGDWNSADGTTRTRRTINGSTGTERVYFRDAARYSVYGQTYADTSAVGSVSGGYSAPTGQASAIIAVEIRGTAGGAPALPPHLVMAQRSY